MDETSGASIWPFIGVALLAGLLGWQIAKRKGLNKRGWATACFFFPPTVIGVAFSKSQQRPGETQAIHNRWASLAAYDPEIKAAVERLSVPNLPDRALKLCVDEKSQIQAVEGTAPVLPMRTGRVECCSHDYTQTSRPQS